MSHYGEEIEFTSPMLVKILGEPSDTLKGKSALRNCFDRGLSAYPELKFETREILVGVNSLSYYYRTVKELLAAEFMEVDRKGLIIKVNAHYNTKI